MCSHYFMNGVCLDCGEIAPGYTLTRDSAPPAPEQDDDAPLWADEIEQVLADLAAGKLSEGQAAKRLGVGRVMLRVLADYRAAAAPLPVVQGGGDLTTDATWSSLASVIARGIVASWEEHENLWDVRFEVQGVGAVMANLSGTDLLSIIADCVARLPHGPGTPGPALELGQSTEAHALICQMVREGAPGFCRESDEYATAQINGLWIGASKPKTEGK